MSDLPIREVARLTGISVPQRERMASARRGPAFVVVNGRNVYPRAAVAQWILARLDEHRGEATIEWLRDSLGQAPLAAARLRARDRAVAEKSTFMQSRVRGPAMMSAVSKGA